jgi:EmrB/QacA subfamily drug resistance transporter
MTTLDDFIVFVAVPSIRRDLHMGASAIQWVVAGYVLAYGVAVISGGRLGDIYGHKRTFMLGLGGFTLASMLCGLAPNTPFLLAARLFEGLMAAIMFPQVFSLIKWMFPQEEQSLAVGILGAVIGVAAIGGQLFGGVLLGANIWGLTWRPIFFVNVPIGVIAALAALPLLSESRSATATRVDGPGVLLVSVVLLLFIYPLVQGREFGWPLWLFVFLIACVPATWLFLRYEQQRTAQIGSPLLELALFRNLLFTRGICILLLETALGSGFFFVLALYLQAGHNFSPFAAGLAFTPMAITYTLGSLVSSSLTRLLGTRILRVGIVIASIGTLWIWLVVTHVGAALTIPSLLPLAVMGFGNALVATPMPGFLIAVAGNDAAGAASGAISTAQQIGAALGVALIGVIFFGVLGSHPSMAGYTGAFAATLLYYTLAICVAQMLLSIGLPRLLQVQGHPGASH